MDYECLQVEITAGIGRMTLNRPDSLNALNETLATDLSDAIPKLLESPSVRVLVIGGAGRAFCAGGDLAMIKKVSERQVGEGIVTERFQRNHDLLKTLYFAKKPIITAVDGIASGAGCNIALAGDIVVATEKAIFVQSSVRVGLVPDWGGMYLLPRLVGLRRAKELVLTGRKLTAQEALQMGMITAVAEDEEFEAVVEHYAATLAQAPGEAIALAKTTLNCSFDQGLDETLEAEKSAQLRCLQTEEHKNAVIALLQDREARRSQR